MNDEDDVDEFERCVAGSSWPWTSAFARTSAGFYPFTISGKNHVFMRIISGILLGLMTGASVQAKLNVVATTPDLASLAAEVGGAKVSITTLARPTEDPHFVDAKPSFITKLNRADVLVEGGAELELGWLPPLLEGARNPKLAAGAPGHISCAKGIQLLDVPAVLDRSKGDLHAMGNPHYLTDPVRASQVARTIADGLSQVDPANAPVYQANLKAFQEKLDKKLAEWQKRLEPYQGHALVAYHNTWPYFAQRFQLKSDLFLEPKPGIPPTPAHLAEVVSTMKQEHIRVIVVEPYQNRKTAETVAASTDAQVVDMTQYPGGLKGTEGGYVALMDYLVESLARALAGSPK
jgi:zinc/manganese transport system substrate-binding protein